MRRAGVRRPAGSLVVVLALTAAVLAACGSSGKTGSGPAGAAEAQPDPDATLRWAAAGDGGGNYDPHTANNPGSTQYLSPAYDRLVYMDPDGKLQPMLATSWTS